MNQARGDVGAAIVAGACIVGAWVGLTAATGKTYHVAPLLAAAAPGFLLRGHPRWRGPALVIGAIAVAGGWLLIVLAGIAPTATIVQGQPGGVGGEVIAFAALGLAVGAGRGPVWLAVRLLRRLRGSRRGDASR